MKTATMMTSKSAAQRLWHSRFEWWTTIVREGVLAGTLGGAVVALWYLLCDTIGGRPFHTPALLGAIFFNGLRGHDVGAATLAPVLSFTLLHFAAFIAFGLASALVIAAAEREPLLVLGALISLRMLRSFLPLFRRGPRRFSPGRNRIVEDCGGKRDHAGNGLRLLPVSSSPNPATFQRALERFRRRRTRRTANDR